MRRLLCVLVILFVSACAGPAASPSPATGTSASGGSAEPDVRPPATPTRTATPGPSQSPASPWPAVGTAPAASTTAGMYLAYTTTYDVLGPVDSLVIFSDGRVVVEDSVPHPVRFFTRRLSASGLAFVQDQVAAVGLFDRSQTRKVVRSPAEGQGVNAALITILSNGKKVEVDEPLMPDGSYEVSSKWDLFGALVEKLPDVGSWIPATGWSDAAWGPYHAPTFCLVLRRDLPDTTPLHAADLEWPAGVRPFASFGKSAIPGQDPDDRVGIISAAAAYKLASSIAVRATAASVPPDDLYTVPLSDGGRMRSPLIDDPDGGWPVIADLWPVSPGMTDCPVH